jgi:drug/metabolite transporter (DMT)-like permease
MAKSKQAHITWLILLGLALTWGSSFILIKQGLLGFSNDSSIVGALRIVITFIVLLPLALLRLRRIKKNQWKILIVIGIISNAAPAFLFAKAQTGIDSNMAGILNSLTPLFTLLIGLAFFQLRPKWYNIAGVFLGLAGAAGLIHFNGEGGFIFNINYAVYILIATICYAASVNIIKTYLEDLDAVSITAFSFAFVGFPVAIYLLFFTDFLGYLSESREAWIGLGYISILAVFGTAIALIFFNRLIKMTSALFASSITYMIPVVAIAWGITDGEKFGWGSFIWILLILGGVYLVNTKRLKSKKMNKTFVQ